MTDRAGMRNQMVGQILDSGTGTDSNRGLLHCSRTRRPVDLGGRPRNQDRGSIPAEFNIRPKQVTANHPSARVEHHEAQRLVGVAKGGKHLKRMGKPLARKNRIVAPAGEFQPEETFAADPVRR